MKYAFFKKAPRNIEELYIMKDENTKQEYIITETISLGKIDFDNFCSDMRVSRDYLENKKIINDGKIPFECVLVKNTKSKWRILVEPDKEGNIISAAIELSKSPV